MLVPLQQSLALYSFAFAGRQRFRERAREWKWLIDECDTRQNQSSTKNPKHFMCASVAFRGRWVSRGMHTAKGRWSGPHLCVLWKTTEMLLSCLFFIINSDLTSTKATATAATHTHIEHSFDRVFCLISPRSCILTFIMFQQTAE